MNPLVLRRNPLAFVALVIAALLILVAATGGGGRSLNVYRSAWEISTECVGLKSDAFKNVNIAGDVNGDGVINKVDLADLKSILYQSNQPATDQTRQYDVNGDGIINMIDAMIIASNLDKAPIRNGVRQLFGGTVRTDFDAADWGLPDIAMSVSNVREGSFTPKQNLTYNLPNWTYQMMYQEYLFDVQFRTYATIVVGDQTGWWEHETSMAFEWASNTARGGDKVGLPASGSGLARFYCVPWGTPTLDVPSGNVFSDYWLGIMDAVVEKVDTGRCSQEDFSKDGKVYEGYTRPASVGAMLTMYQDDGQFVNAYPKVNWDTQMILAPSSRNVIIVDVPFDMEAGAWERFDRFAAMGGGSIVELKPIDVYITYTVRVATFLVVESRKPVTPVDPKPIERPKDFTPIPAASFFDKYGTWILIAAIVLIVLAVLAIFVGLPFLVLMGPLRMCTANYKNGDKPNYLLWRWQR